MPTLLDDRVRARVRALPNVQVTDGCDAAGLVPSADGRGVRGLRILCRAASSTAEQLDGDLIVDATGRASRAPRWLEELGYPSPPEDEVRIGLAYATRSYRRAPGSPGGAAVAAVEALRLADCLSGGREQLARRFFRAAGEVVDIAWDISTGGDLRFPGVVGPRTAKVRAVNAYLERLHVAAESDPEVGRAFFRVVNLLDPPQRLLAPAMALRVRRGSSGRDLRGIDRASALPVRRRPAMVRVSDRSAD